MQRTKYRRLPYIVLLWLTALMPATLTAQTTPEITSSTIGAMRARHIGPATMSGRVAALDAVKKNPLILYVGGADGGVWKTINGGVDFKPVFDDHVQSIGAITIDQEHPDTVWAGTGESWVRNSVSVGRGVFKTTNGGDSWEALGLDSTEHIARIVINRDNPDVVYVAALGHLWNANSQRGVFRTKDGGKTWEKVLYVDENTGCSDIDIDPFNPDILVAGMWDFRRTPYDFRSGGPGSALYITKDGGNSWQKLTEGLPATPYGRIAVGISTLKKGMIYALIEAGEKGGLYRSDDYGASWKLMNTTPPITERPFYFSQVYPDPVDTFRVYKPSTSLYVSNDGGQKFRPASIVGANVHPDLHALWIGAPDNNLLYLGTDGGVYKSNDKGNSWLMIRDLPLSQFYHVSVDMQKPYHVYGGLQDNGSWMGPSKSPGGINNADWKSIGFGDGFYASADPTDNNILYWQWQGGNFVRYYKNTGETKEIRPYANEETGKLRWNWNSAIAFSPDGESMYVGSQYLWKSGDRGDSWARISPDLTTNDTSKIKQEESGGLTIDNSTAENYCTIYTIAESPLDNRVIWSGTDDGNLQVTKDGGSTWENVVGNIPGLPSGTWCSSVEPSRFDKASVFVTFDGHRSGDMTSYVYVSNDFGQNFNPLATSQVNGYCYVVRQDPVKPELLFLGTEFGLYTSFDKGANWVKFKNNFPEVSVQDMVIHPRENDLVVATHGRGIFIFDDITPLRGINNDILDKDLAFLPSRPYLIGNIVQTQNFGGDDEFIGRNPANGAYIDYYMKKRHIFGDMSIEIYDSTGTRLTTLPAGKRKGMNRVIWIPREKPPKVPASNNLVPGAFIGPTYLPGDYKVKVLKGDEVFEGNVTLKYDPALPYSDADRQLQLTNLRKAYHLLEDLAFTDAKIVNVMEQVNKYIDSPGFSKRNVKKMKEYTGKLEKLHKSLVATKTGGITGEEQLREKLSDVYSAILRYSGKPTNSQIERLDVLKEELYTKNLTAESLMGPELVMINKLITSAGNKPIMLLTREAFNSRD